MVEWNNPIFYINFLGLVASAVLVLKTRRARAEGSLDARWFLLSVVFLVGTTLHFVGDLVNFYENADHVFIHTVVAAGLLIPAISALRD